MTASAKNVALSLDLLRRTAPPMGGYARYLAIWSNEVMRARNELEELRAEVKKLRESQ